MPDTNKIGWNAVSKTGAVAAGGAGAVAAGIQILEAGGNAADAAAGTILALNVTDHIACSIGGEVPVLIFDAEKREVKSLSGQGRAPLSQEAIDWYMKNGIPAGDMKMAPVPSVVDLCITMLQQYGTKTFEEIVVPTRLPSWTPETRIGIPTSRSRYAGWLRKNRLRPETVRRSCKLRPIAFTDGTSIAMILRRNWKRFTSRRVGFLRRADLAAHTTLIEDPVKVDYRGYTVYKCGTWTQGPYLCQALRLLEGFDLKGYGTLLSRLCPRGHRSD